MRGHLEADRQTLARARRRTMSRERPVERCRKCSGAPVSRTSSRSRNTISSSASAGRPRRPSRALSAPSFIVPPGGESLVLAVLCESHSEWLRVGEGPSHHRRVLHPHAVVGEQSNAERRHLGHRRERLAAAPHGDRAGDGDVERACGRPARARRRRAATLSSAGSVFGIATSAQ